MLDGQLCPDLISYSALISAYGEQWPRAVRAFREMLRQRIHGDVVSCSADVISYSAAISSCETEGQWRKALHLFHLMKHAELLPDVISYNAAISSCEKGSQWHLACHFLSSSSCANVISYNSAISSCAKASAWQVAMQLVSHAMPHQGIRPNLLTATELSNALIAAGQLRLGLQALSAVQLPSQLKPQNGTRSTKYAACNSAVGGIS
eukprot:Skav205777  [mRNA]  locus=scaffold1714:690856:694318:- [translate_table: standard]